MASSATKIIANPYMAIRAYPYMAIRAYPYMAIRAYPYMAISKVLMEIKHKLIKSPSVDPSPFPTPTSPAHIPPGQVF